MERPEPEEPDDEPDDSVTFNLGDSFPSSATLAEGQTCGSPVTYFPTLNITNSLSCTANLVTVTSVGADDLLETDGSIWPNPNCGTQTTSISAGTTLLSHVAPGATVSVNYSSCTGAGGTIAFECA